MPNPYVNKVIVNGISKIDLTGDTVTANKLLSGYTAHNAAGAAITGTYTPAVVSLNVVAYAAEFPATAEPYTIGIISATAVTGYSIGTSAPAAGLVDGFVWIKSGSYSPVPISLTENITIYPITAEQYQGGIWVEVDTRVYKNGAWVSLQRRLYTSADGTGTQNVPWTANSYAAISDASGYIRVGRTSATSNRGIVYTTNLIDVTDYSKLFIEYKRDSSDAGGGIYYGVSDTQSPSGYVLSATGTSKTRTTASLDISSVTGYRYILMNNNYTGQYIKLAYVYNVWLE